jgi:acetamidase/formamidase
MRKHRVEAGPDSVHWGFFDAALKPLITIESGDEVTMSTVSGSREAMPQPDSGLTVPPALSAIHATVPQRLSGPHIMTGPVAVRGAKAGQVLEVRIKSIELHYDWGYNVIRPLAGALPDDFTETRLIHIPLDRARMTGRLPWGLELPLKPFFGVMVVGPPHAWGPVASRHRGATAATSTTKNWSPAPRSICQSTSTARCSRSATVTGCKATAKSASPQSRPA